MTVVIDTPVSSFGFGRRTHSEPEPVQVNLADNTPFLSEALGEPQRFHYSSRTKLYVVGESNCDQPEYDVPTVSLGIQALHQAFAAHAPFSLRPDTLWYFIIHEVAEYIRQNSAECAGLFTDTPESKQTILVRDDSLRYDAPSDWMTSINLVRDPLAAKISDRTMDMFLPRFSTSTIEDETALLVSLMDAASPYYEFKWFTRCGIPQIRLEGNASDWVDLYNRADQLARTFTGLRAYFTDLLPVLRTIAETAGGSHPDEEFWRSIYKYQDMSGGAHVSGWINAFFAYLQTKDGRVQKEECDWRQAFNGWGGTSTNQFPSHVSKVPFIWDYFGTEYNMAFAAGVTGVDFEDNFLSPRLGFAVVEI